ncbi:MAG: hypothetical protein KatS3mg057_2925 [Herpetosiphonaceae bacterium]|nr:MAG: hypothetical protein KatS3mg057_2925 [Herpetosiphonaceae bacterium]
MVDEYAAVTGASFPRTCRIAAVMGLPRGRRAVVAACASERAAFFMADGA